MKSLQIKSKCGRMILTVDAEDPKALFEAIAQWQEVFDVEHCGQCKSKNIKFVVRCVGQNKFHEIHCCDCKARRTYGVNRDGSSLFPHRKSKDGSYLPCDGWTRYQKPQLAPTGTDN